MTIRKCVIKNLPPECWEVFRSLDDWAQQWVLIGLHNTPVDQLGDRFGEELNKLHTPQNRGEQARDDYLSELYRYRRD